MAPTHDRVVGMDPDDVKTPISAPHFRTLENANNANNANNEHRPSLPPRASTNPKHNGDSATRALKKDDIKERPELPTRPSEIAGYGGAEAVRTRTQEVRENVCHDAHNLIDKMKSAATHHKRDPTSRYFKLEARVSNHLEAQFEALCKGEKGLRTSEFARFLREEQGQDVQLPEDKHEKTEFGMSAEKRWTYKEWLAFMCRSGAIEGVRPVGKAGLVRQEGMPKGEETQEERIALSYPITSYFIDSSHNTYLQGHQWFSKSTEEAYEYVLRKGCRCIEIDVHNGGSILKGGGVKSIIKPTAPSEILDVASKKIDKAQNKLDKKWIDLKKWAHKKKDSISGGNKSPGLEELSRELDGGNDVGHHKTQISTGTLPKISKEPSTDSEGGSIRSDDAVDLNGEGQPISNKSSRASSKSSDTSSVHPERTGEPIVMHGWTPTKNWCFFRDVCKTVRQHAFDITNLPLIVSLEVACTLEQQELMVKIMKEEWNGMLVDKPLPGCDPTIRQPRLDELFNKILVKVKRHVPHGEELADADAAHKSAVNTAAPNGTNPDVENGKVVAPMLLDGLDQSESTTSSQSQSTLLTPKSTSTASGNVSGTTSVSSVTPTQTPSGVNLSPNASVSKLGRLDTTSTNSSSATRSRSHSNPSKSSAQAKLPKICKNLSALGIYTHSAHFSNFLETSSYSPSHIYSIDESDILKLYEDHAAEMHAHNKKYFMRVYPQWKRISSSNLDPSVYWRKGVQMAAVNAQTWDEGTMVNRGMFEGTGGWVLKPANLRPDRKNPTWNPEGKTREDAEAGIDGDGGVEGRHVGTPITAATINNQAALSPNSEKSPTEGKAPVGLGLELDDHQPKALDRAIALDPPSRKPSKKEKIKSPRRSDASQSGLPLSPKTFTPVASPKPPGNVFSGLLLGPKQIDQLKQIETPKLMDVVPAKKKPKTLNLYFRIFAAQGLHSDDDSDMHPRVKIEMHAEKNGDFKSDDWKKETKSKHTSNPDWNGEEVRFMNIGSKGDPDDHVRGHIAGPQEEMSFVRFKIEDDIPLKKDVTLAWRAVRLDRLRTGWRFLRLWDAEGEEGGGLLLIHVRREET